MQDIEEKEKNQTSNKKKRGKTSLPMEERQEDKARGGDSCDCAQGRGSIGCQKGGNREVNDYAAHDRAYRRERLLNPGWETLIKRAGLKEERADSRP